MPGMTEHSAELRGQRRGLQMLLLLLLLLLDEESDSLLLLLPPPAHLPYRACARGWVGRGIAVAARRSAVSPRAA